MAIKKPEINEIRNFTDRSSYKNWLPSLDSADAFKKTWTLKTNNVIPQTGQAVGEEGSGTGEINILTDFNQSDTKNLNLNRFTLFLYCLRHDPYFFDSIQTAISYDSDSRLFLQSLQNFITGFQVGTTKSQFSKSLVTDLVRVYRGTKVKDVQDTKSVQEILDYAQKPNSDFQRNVVGVLGKVTYDSVIKHTLYAILLNNGIIQDYSKPAGTWAEISNQLNIDEYKLYLDVNGGPYRRAFPVICVLAKKEKGKSLDDLIEESNKLVGSKFFRTLTKKDQLVTEIKVGNEKNFVENPLSQTNYSTYYIIYDFAKVITLDPFKGQDYTLSLLKIGLSLLSRKNGISLTLSEFEEYYKKVSAYLISSLSEEYEDLNFKIALQNKHTKECEYVLDKSAASLKTKIANPFKLQLQLLVDSLNGVYKKITDIFKEQVLPSSTQNFQFKDYPSDLESEIILHFDNFYNLLAVTSRKKAVEIKQVELNKNVPFDLEKYQTDFSSDDLVVKFFSNQNTNALPVFADGEYQFTPNIALQEDIVFVTEAFLKELYYNLDVSKNFIYETDKNQNEDDVLSLKEKSFELLKLISQRTKIDLKKEDYFFISSNNIYLRKEVVKKLELSELNFLFDSVKEDKIKFQTIGHFLYAPMKKNPTLDHIITNVYYPKLIQSVSPAPETPPTPEPPPTKKPPKNNNYLINNIITSELNCYADIADSFDQAINADDIYDKLYFASRSLVFIGLPILLTYAAQQLADKLSKISKNKINPSLLDCLLQDSQNLKKLLIGASDIALSDNPEQLLLQFVPQLPRIPEIPYFPVFDLEKELKRRIIEFVIEQLITLLKNQLGIALQPIIDMCNSDSYLTSFLDRAIPNVNLSDKKLSSPTPAGLPAGAISTTYIPNITADINILIDQTGIATRESVYEYFRINFIVSKEDYSDLEISNFFDYISDKIDAGQLVSLLKGSSSLQTRNLLIAYVKTYSDKFSSLINDQESLIFLFLFLGKYIDYKLILTLISNSLLNFTPTVCVDIDSRFDELSSVFTDEQLEDQANDLENALADVCSFKKPLTIDLIASGPPLLTKTLDDTLTKTFNGILDSLYRVVLQINKETENKETTKELAKSIPDLYTILADGSGNLPTNSDILIYITQSDVDETVSNFFIAGLYKILLYGTSFDTSEFLADVLKIINGTEEEINKIRDYYKQIFSGNLKKSGNVGLKTNQVVFSGYVNKFKQLSSNEVYKETNVDFVLEDKKTNLADMYIGEKGSPFILLPYAETNDEFVSESGKNYRATQAKKSLYKDQQDLYKKLEQLHYEISIFGNSYEEKRNKIKNIIESMNDYERCWLCARRAAYLTNQGTKYSEVTVLQKELDSGDLNQYLYAPLGNGSQEGCKVYGYDSIEGGGTYKCKDLSK